MKPCEQTLVPGKPWLLISCRVLAAHLAQGQIGNPRKGCDRIEISEIETIPGSEPVILNRFLQREVGVEVKPVDVDFVLAHKEGRFAHSLDGLCKFAIR